MASWSIVRTTEGSELYNKVLSGSATGPLKITRVVACKAGVTNPKNTTKADLLASSRYAQDLKIIDVTDSKVNPYDSEKSTIVVQLNNADSSAYSKGTVEWDLYVIGILVKTDDTDEVLFSIATDSDPDTIPKLSETPLVSNYTFNIITSDVEVTNATADFSGFITSEVFNALKDRVLTVEDDYLSKSKGGTVKGEVEFQKNVRVKNSHILGPVGTSSTPTADIDFGYVGTLCLGLRDGNSTTSDWKSYIEFGQSSGIRSYSPSNNFNSLKGSYGLIASNSDNNSEGSIIIASGCDGDYIENPSVAYSTLYNLFQSVSSYEDVDWDDVDKKLSAYGDIKILSSGDMFLLSNGDSMTLISKRGIKLFSDDMQTRAIGGSCTDIDSDFYEEINSERYKSYHTKEHRIFAGGDMYLIPGHSGVDGNDTDGNHSVIVSNLKGKTSSSGVKPKITNFSDIHSANFEEGGENLINKYNRKFFNVVECVTASDVVVKEITLPDFSTEKDYPPFIMYLKNANIATSFKIKVEGIDNTIDVFKRNTENLIADLESGYYILNYDSDGPYFSVLGKVSNTGLPYHENSDDDEKIFDMAGLLRISKRTNNPLVIDDFQGILEHRNTAGYKHIPEGGDKGQVLVNTGVSGEVEWKTPEAQSISVDDELSDTSINPVQNKVIKKALDGVIPYGICQTAGNESSKTVEIPNFKLSDHCWFYLIFTNDNSSGSATLTVNGEGGFDIYYWNALGFFEDIKANILYLVYLDGADSGTFYLIDTTSALSNFKADSSPVSGSSNLITSGGVYTALSGKADTSDIPKSLKNPNALTVKVGDEENPTTYDGSSAVTVSVDTTPTEGSNNLVTSGGVYTALSTKADNNFSNSTSSYIGNIASGSLIKVAEIPYTENLLNINFSLTLGVQSYIKTNTGGVFENQNYHFFIDCIGDYKYNSGILGTGNIFEGNVNEITNRKGIINITQISPPTDLINMYFRGIVFVRDTDKNVHICLKILDEDVNSTVINSKIYNLRVEIHSNIYNGNCTVNTVTPYLIEEGIGTEIYSYSTVSN